MKKLGSFLVFASVVILANNTHAQIKKGNFIIDPYIGFPTENIVYQSNSSNEGFRFNGPPVSFGGRAEYMLVNKVGFGMDVNYSISGFQHSANYFNPQTGSQTNGVYSYRVTKLRSMVRFNYHFFQSTSFDVYTGFGFGYRQSEREAYYDNVPTTNYPNDILYLDSPLAFRFCIGAKYYFSNMVGATIEFGSSGGSVVQVGLSIKLLKSSQKDD